MVAILKQNESVREKIGMTSLNFKCNRCDGKFQTFISLMKHRNVPSKYNGRKCGDILQKICLSASMVDFLKHNRNFKLIQCKTCQKGFSHIYCFLVHLRIHKKQAPYVCDYCSKTFIIGLNLGRHLEFHKKDVQHLPKCERCSNDIDKLMKLLKVDYYSNCCRCPFCHKNIKANRNFIVAHLRIHFQEHSICAKCNFRIVRYRKIMVKLKSKVLLQSPIRSFRRTGGTGSSLIECERCGVWFKRNQLALHLISHSMEQLHCRYCDVMFRSRYLLKKHEATCERKEVTTESEGISLKSSSLKERNSKQCPFCSQTFVCFTTLKMHLPTHAENHSLKWDFESLEEEPDETMRETNLETNSKHFHGTNGFSERNLRPNTLNQCSFCLAIFQNVSERNLHEMNHYKIPTCYSKFYSNEYQIQHHSNLLYQCKYCRNVFMSVHNLNSHIDCHFEKPPFLCKICWKVFTSLDGYFDHKKNHVILKNKDNPHISSSSIRLCEICGEVFQNLNIFKKHLKYHEMKCIYCSTHFSTDKSLHDHMKQHLVSITGDNDRSQPSAPPRENIDVQYSTPEGRYNESTLENVKNNRFPKAETDTDLVPDKRNNLSMSPQSCESGLDSTPFYKNRPNLVPFSSYQFESPKVSSFCEKPLLQIGSDTEYCNPLPLQKNKNDIIFSVADSDGFSHFNDGKETCTTKPTCMNINCNFSNREKIDLPYKDVNVPVSETLGMDNFNTFKNNINTVAALEPITAETTNLRYRDYYSCSNEAAGSKYLCLKTPHLGKNSVESSNILNNKQECSLISDIPFDKYVNTLSIRDNENQHNNEKENEIDPVLIQIKHGTKATFLDKCSDSNGISHFNENSRLVIDTNNSNVFNLEQSICGTWESKQKEDSNEFQLKERTRLVPTSPLKKPESKRYQPVDLCFIKSSTIKEEFGCQPKSKSKNIYGEYNFPKYSISFKKKSSIASSQSNNNGQDKESTCQNRKKILEVSEIHSNWDNKENKLKELMTTKVSSETPEDTDDANCRVPVNESHFNYPNSNILCNNLIDYSHTTLATSCDRGENFSFIEHPDSK